MFKNCMSHSTWYVAIELPCTRDLARVGFPDFRWMDAPAIVFALLSKTDARHKKDENMKDLKFDCHICSYHFTSY